MGSRGNDDALAQQLVTQMSVRPSVMILVQIRSMMATAGCNNTAVSYQTKASGCAMLSTRLSTPSQIFALYAARSTLACTHVCILYLLLHFCPPHSLSASSQPDRPASYCTREQTAANNPSSVLRAPCSMLHHDLPWPCPALFQMSGRLCLFSPGLGAVTGLVRPE